MRCLLTTLVPLMLAACSPASVLNAIAPGAGVSITHGVAYAAGSRHTLDIYAPEAATKDAVRSGASAVDTVSTIGTTTNRPAAAEAAPPETAAHAAPDGATANGAAAITAAAIDPVTKSGPAPVSSTGVPVVLFIYGGGWKDGDKSLYRFLGTSLAARGFLTVVPDYRVFPQVRFPVFIQDAATAFAWTRANIARYGGDPHRIFLMGHSAGAHIAAMLTLDKQWLGAEGLDPDQAIAGMIGLAGPYDFLPLHDPELDDIFAPAGDLRLTQPITYARGNAPPMFLAAGEGDTTVLPRNTINLAAAIRRDGGQVEEKLYPRIGHLLIIGSIAGPLRWFAPVLRDITTFLDRHDGRMLASVASPGQ